MAELYDAVDEIPKWDEAFSSSTPEPVLVLDSKFQDAVLEISNDLFSDVSYDPEDSVINLHARDENGGDVMLGLTIEDAWKVIGAMVAVITHHTPERPIV
jgi:hypothetical protein